MRSSLIIFTLCMLLTSCYSIGPRQITLDRNRYNDVIQDTNNEQLLMNIVHLRYLEPLRNLKLTNVTSSYTLNPGISTLGTGLSYISGGKSAPSAAGSSKISTINLEPSVQYQDTPTISYTPVDGAVFAEEMMSPIKLYKVHLLMYGGINDPELIMRLFFQDVGDLDNASSATSERMRSLPDYKKYYNFVNKFSKLINEHKAYLTLEKINKHFVWSIWFYPQYKNAREVREVKSMLGINSHRNEIIFSDLNYDFKQDNIVYVRMRSIYGMLVFLSYGVQVPEKDIKNNYVYSYYNNDGTSYNWKPLTQGLLTVSSSESEPTEAFVKTKIHGHWFYIANSDLDSKATFVLVTRIIDLNSSSLNKLETGPLLTLPAR